MSYDLTDPTVLFQHLVGEPEGLYAHLRANAPVWEIPGTGTFS